MAHFGELDISQHPNGEPCALEIAYVIKFPITSEQAMAVAERGGKVYKVSIGQEVEFPNGAGIFHGKIDGLHSLDDPLFP